jgi:RNA polymerase sigma factor (sigma-70 family)
MTGKPRTTTMAHGQLNPVLRFIRKLDEHGHLAAQSDVQLLERFVVHHDETAFAALLKRHGPMVLGVCRRILHDAHEAEDAFQVTFLVLACKAKTLGQRELLGNWLHGVAYRTALKARSRLTRWRCFTGTLSDVPALEPLSDLAWDELQLVLDEEIQRLPAKYRTPAVMCCLEGHSFADAARQLGWPVGTIAGRLARARELLRPRLTRRGFTLSAGLLGTILSAHATSAAVPAALSDSTVTAALACAAGRVSASVVSAKVAALTEGVIKAMFLQKLKVVEDGVTLVV